MYRLPQFLTEIDLTFFGAHSVHPDRIGDPSVFKLKVESTFTKHLERQVTVITNSNADYLMNYLEWSSK